MSYIWQKITTFEKLSKVLIIVLWSPTHCSSPHISEWILVITLTGSCRCSWCQRQTGAPLGCWWYCCHRASHHRETLLEALLSNYESPLQHPLSRHWTPSHCRTRPHLITPLQAERRHLTSILFLTCRLLALLAAMSMRAHYDCSSTNSWWSHCKPGCDYNQGCTWFNHLKDSNHQSKSLNRLFSSITLHHFPPKKNYRIKTKLN